MAAEDRNEDHVERGWRGEARRVAEAVRRCRAAAWRLDGAFGGAGERLRAGRRQRAARCGRDGGRLRRRCAYPSRFRRRRLDVVVVVESASGGGRVARATVPRTRLHSGHASCLSRPASATPRLVFVSVFAVVFFRRAGRRSAAESGALSPSVCSSAG